jgi:hypothetical protein
VVTRLGGRAEDPALAALLDLEPGDGGTIVDVGSTRIRFLPDGPPGRPQLHAELFL